MSFGSLSRERWAVLEPLLDRALELDSARRSRFLDEACGSNAALREEIESLLEACEAGGFMLSTPAAVTFAPLLDDPIPVRLGDRYHVVREVARGGMATVFLADDPKHNRQVAVKVLHPKIARMIGPERFTREIEIAAGLSHPHILPLHDSGEVPSDRRGEPPLLYFVSPYVPGESLRERLQREPRLTTQEVVRLGRQIALALDYAHRMGVIHLDIKPGNILLHEGHAVIGDFGIARAMSSSRDDALAKSLPLLGTPSYMSPEQAAGEPDIDGRSDVYSLGCVLYEMIVGERPFAQTSLAPVVDGGTRPAPDPALLMQRVPRELGMVVLRAMSAAREDRYATAGELARALSTAARASGKRWRRAIIPASVITLITASLLIFAAQSTRTTLDADLVAVAPFDVESPSLGLWKEGLVDVLSRTLDGAGPLHTVPASIIVRQWRGRADVTSASTLGLTTGARLVLYGGLLAAGDSVRANAVLFDVSTGRAIAEFDQRDLSGRMDRLADSLTVAVLREVGRSRGTNVGNAPASTTTSLSALKAYLQGEQYYRAARWDSAQVHFERAVTIDTTFALAYHRLAAVHRFRDTHDVPDSVAYVMMRRPSRFQRGLSERELLLAQIDSMTAETYFTWRRALQNGDYTDLETGLKRLYSTLQAAIRRYPNDAELWLMLAEARSRYEGDAVVGEVDDRATLALYDRAIALDSTFAPAYVPPIALAAYLDGAASARRYIRAYLSLTPSGPNADAIRLADVLLDPVRSASLDVPRLVDTLPADALCRATALLRHVPDPNELVVRISRTLLARRNDARAAAALPMCAFGPTVDGLLFHGRLRDALLLASMTAHGLELKVRYDMADAGALSVDSARAQFKQILALAPRIRVTRLYRWWAKDGDTSSIQTYLNQFIMTDRSPHSASVSALLRSNITSGRAFLALAKRDTAFALRVLLTTGDTLHPCWSDGRMALVSLLVAEGRYRQAGGRLERRWPGTTHCTNGYDDVVWSLERARVFERLGRRDQAAANYRFVADVWRTADPELQPAVRESLDALERLAMSAPPTRVRN